MKLRILSVIILSAISLRTSAQSLEVAFGDSVVSSNQLNTGAPPAAHVYIRNASTEFKTVKVVRQVLSLNPGHETYYCWSTSCYGPATNISPDIVPLDVGEVDSTFKGYVLPNGSAGVSKVRYCFRTEEDTSDKVCFVVNFKYGVTSIRPEEPSGRLTAIEANYDQGNQTIHVDVNGGKIDVMNMLGQQVPLSFRYDGSGMTADASTLKTGYYFLFGRNEKGPWSARVIVNKQ